MSAPVMLRAPTLLKQLYKRLCLSVSMGCRLKHMPKELPNANLKPAPTAEELHAVIEQSFKKPTFDAQELHEGYFKIEQARLLAEHKIFSS